MMTRMTRRTGQHSYGGARYNLAEVIVSGGSSEDANEYGKAIENVIVIVTWISNVPLDSGSMLGA